MKIIAITGSRNPKGQTAKAVSALLAGAKGKSAKVEQVMLAKMCIERCRQCEDDGWGICWTKGRCVIDDDFAALVGKIRAADAAVFATPVYFSDLSESLRAFLDRLRRITRHNKGKARITGKRAVGVCVAGGGGGGAPACTVSLEKVLATCGFDVVDMVPARRQNLKAKLAVLKLSGKSLVSRRP
jgi:multimeric flavodoxin WrbA